MDSEEAQVAEVRYSVELELAPGSEEEKRRAKRRLPLGVSKRSGELAKRKGPEMREMMDFEIWRQHREELMREAEQNRSP